MEMGTVKWFNNAKGFGFICPEGGGEDIFAHYSTIQMDGYRTLKAGSPSGSMYTRGQKAITPVLSCPLKQKRLHSSLIHCVHPQAKCQPDRLAFLFSGYSRASASTGSSRAAFRAGSQPKRIPVKVEHKNAVRIAIGEKPLPSP